MVSWGITMRQSDYGLDLLDLLILQQLKETDFVIFNGSKAVELLWQDILETIKEENQGCSLEDMDFYIAANFPQNFTVSTSDKM